MKASTLCFSLLVASASSTYLRHGGNDVSSFVEDEPAIILGDHHNSTSYARKLQASKTRSILVLRIVNNGVGPTVSAADLNRYIFTDTNSLHNQMIRCSAGALGFYPATQGVVDVPVSTQHQAQSLINAAVRDGAKAAGVSDLRSAADHVVFVLPKVDNYFATAEVGGSFSYYNNENAASLAVLLHEIGHNLNLHHAGVQGDEYGDYSGNMGRSKVMRGGPKLCYNAGNHWSLNWFTNRRKDFQSQGPAVPEKFQLSAFVDYKNSQFPVLAKVGDHYMQYNYRKSYNDGSDALVNQLVIVSLANTKKTTLQKGLSVHQEFKGPNYVVRVCGQSKSGSTDYLTVSIGRTYTDCNAGLSTTTAQITGTTASNVGSSWGTGTTPTISWGTKPASTWSFPPKLSWGSAPGSSSTSGSSGWSSGFQWSRSGGTRRTQSKQQAEMSDWSSFACLLGGC